MNFPDLVSGIFLSPHPTGGFDIRTLLAAPYKYSPARIFLGMRPAYLMQCCGASSLEWLSAEFLDEKEKQNFVWKLYHNITPSQSYYCIAATYQIEQSKSHENTYSVLMSLGMVELDAYPNRNHGPNDMHMHRWSPVMEPKTGWDKYLTFDVDGSVQPIWWSKLSEKEQLKIQEDAKLRWQEHEKSLASEQARRKAGKLANEVHISINRILDGKIPNSTLEHYGLKIVKLPQAEIKDNARYSSYYAQTARIGLATYPEWKA